MHPKQTLFIGSTCVDVVLNVDNVPKPGEDESVYEQTMIVGGCAYNAATIMRQFGLAHTLCSPVGTGIYGDFIRRHFENMKIAPFVQNPDMPNGCCYCIVEPNGRRTFLCQHGAEYKFSKEWFKNIDFSAVDGIYFCGLEIEDSDGEKIVCFLEELKSQPQNQNINLFFAPGPRICSINKSLLQRIFALNPILHLNDDEALSFTSTKSVESAAIALFDRTNNSVIITCGKLGAYTYDAAIKTGKMIATVPNAKVADTTGAGDSHCGTVIASLKQGFSLFEAVRRGNIIASVVVGQKGATISQQLFDQTAKLL